MEFFKGKDLTHYQHLAEEEIEEIKTGRASVFRERAGENEHEFFAKALETFFEKPAEFKAEVPELYQS